MNYDEIHDSEMENKCWVCGEDLIDGNKCPDGDCDSHEMNEK